MGTDFFTTITLADIISIILSIVAISFSFYTFFKEIPYIKKQAKSAEEQVKEAINDRKGRDCQEAIAALGKMKDFVDYWKTLKINSKSIISYQKYLFQSILICYDSKRGVFDNSHTAKKYKQEVTNNFTVFSHLESELINCINMSSPGETEHMILKAKNIQDDGLLERFSIAIDEEIDFFKKIIQEINTAS